MNDLNEENWKTEFSTLCDHGIKMFVWISQMKNKEKNKFIICILKIDSIYLFGFGMTERIIVADFNYFFSNSFTLDWMGRDT